MTDLNAASAPHTDTHRLVVAALTLLGAGTFLGISTNLAKAGIQSGMAPTAFLFWSVCGASLILLSIAALKGHLPPLNRTTVVYFLIAAFFTVAASNVLFFSAVPRVGVGFVVLALTLPPVLTYIGALILGMERVCAFRLLAVIFAFAGSGYLAWGQITTPGADTLWVALTLFGPVLLAAGNIYRSAAWQQGLSADQLAPGMMIAAALLVGAALPFMGDNVPLAPESPTSVVLIALQSAVLAPQFILVFILQRVGGPVFLSLYGSVAAVVGVFVAFHVLGEALPPGLLPGGTGIALGIVLMIFGAYRAKPA